MILIKLKSNITLKKIMSLGIKWLFQKGGEKIWEEVILVVNWRLYIVA